MPKRTYEADGREIELANDLERLVADKREAWRATPAKARRRQRRYGKPLTKALMESDSAI